MSSQSASLRTRWKRFLHSCSLPIASLVAELTADDDHRQLVEAYSTVLRLCPSSRSAVLDQLSLLLSDYFRIWFEDASSSSTNRCHGRPHHRPNVQTFSNDLSAVESFVHELVVLLRELIKSPNCSCFSPLVCQWALGLLRPMMTGLSSMQLAAKLRFSPTTISAVAQPPTTLSHRSTLSPIPSAVGRPAQPPIAAVSFKIKSITHRKRPLTPSTASDSDSDVKPPVSKIAPALGSDKKVESDISQPDAIKQATESTITRVKEQDSESDSDSTSVTSSTSQHLQQHDDISPSTTTSSNDTVGLVLSPKLLGLWHRCQLVEDLLYLIYDLLMSEHASVENVSSLVASSLLSSNDSGDQQPSPHWVIVWLMTSQRKQQAPIARLVSLLLDSALTPPTSNNQSRSVTIDSPSRLQQWVSNCLTHLLFLNACDLSCIGRWLDNQFASKDPPTNLPTLVRLVVNLTTLSSPLQLTSPKQDPPRSESIPPAYAPPTSSSHQISSGAWPMTGPRRFGAPPPSLPHPHHQFGHHQRPRGGPMQHPMSQHRFPQQQNPTGGPSYPSFGGLPLTLLGGPSLRPPPSQRLPPLMHGPPPPPHMRQGPPPLSSQHQAGSGRDHQWSPPAMVIDWFTQLAHDIRVEAIDAVWRGLASVKVIKTLLACGHHLEEDRQLFHLAVRSLLTAPVNSQASNVLAFLFDWASRSRVCSIGASNLVLSRTGASEDDCMASLCSRLLNYLCLSALAMVNSTNEDDPLTGCQGLLEAASKLALVPVSSDSDDNDDSGMFDASHDDQLDHRLFYCLESPTVSVYALQLLVCIGLTRRSRLLSDLLYHICTASSSDNKHSPTSRCRYLLLHALSLINIGLSARRLSYNRSAITVLLSTSVLPRLFAGSTKQSLIVLRVGDALLYACRREHLGQAKQRRLLTNLLLLDRHIDSLVRVILATSDLRVGQTFFNLLQLVLSSRESSASNSTPSLRQASLFASPTTTSNLRQLVARHRLLASSLKRLNTYCSSTTPTLDQLHWISLLIRLQRLLVSDLILPAELASPLKYRHLAIAAEILDDQSVMEKTPDDASAQQYSQPSHSTLLLNNPPPSIHLDSPYSSSSSAMVSGQLINKTRRPRPLLASPPITRNSLLSPPFHWFHLFYGTCSIIADKGQNQGDTNGDLLKLARYLAQLVESRLMPYGRYLPQTLVMLATSGEKSPSCPIEPVGGLALERSIDLLTTFSGQTVKASPGLNATVVGPTMHETLLEASLLAERQHYQRCLQTATAKTPSADTSATSDSVAEASSQEVVVGMSVCTKLFASLLMGCESLWSGSQSPQVSAAKAIRFLSSNNAVYAQGLFPSSSRSSSDSDFDRELLKAQINRLAVDYCQRRVDTDSWLYRTTNHLLTSLTSQNQLIAMTATPALDHKSSSQPQPPPLDRFLSCLTSRELTAFVFDFRTNIGQKLVASARLQPSTANLRHPSSSSSASTPPLSSVPGLATNGFEVVQDELAVAVDDGEPQTGTKTVTEPNNDTVYSSYSRHIMSTLVQCHLMEPGIVEIVPDLLNTRPGV